jgi:hypothetical protein
MLRPFLGAMEAQETIGRLLDAYQPDRIFAGVTGIIG